MNKFKKLIVCVLVFALSVTGFVPFTGAVDTAEAATKFPSETNPFVSNHYVDPINQDAPFFDKVLPEIAKNIKTNNKHSISPYYDKLPVAKNPENFQGLGSTTYANINGKTVTAEAFYRLSSDSLCDPNAGLGLLIYQCIQYKRVHPEEDVKITFSSYRTSATASVCVIPESKYYGYMRSLYGTNYDEHGFVRVSYMLTEAARMGIEVTMVNQLPSYAVKQYNPKTKKLEKRSHINFKTYFEKAVKGDCYEKYAPGKKVSDYLNVVNVDWEIGDKTGDMQHVKSASASHYLATDGTEHKNAVFYSSSNFDENDYLGRNGNGNAQSGVIVSDHEELYRINYNYMKLMEKYKYQEGIYELRRVAKELNEEQIKLIKSGKEKEIPADEQIVYLGSKNDPVFELYFTPLGGGADAWELEYNPISKYADKLKDSEGYVEFIWNEYGYGECNLGKTLSGVLQKAFCEKPNHNNKYHSIVPDFDPGKIKDLNLGSEIGYRYIQNGGKIHAKDMQMSYVEDGKRHRVSIMTSCNFYMIAFNYRTNSMLVINETDKTGGNFYNIFGAKYSNGMINNNLMIKSSHLTLDKGTSQKIDYAYSGKKTLKWTSSNEAIATVSKGKVTAKKEGTVTITLSDGTYKDTLTLNVVNCTKCMVSKGLTCNTDHQYVLPKKLADMPNTFEATFSVDKSILKSTTTILGNDGNYDPALVYYLDKSGHPKVTVRSKASTSVKSTYVFSKVNVATGKKVHLAIAYDADEKKLRCYVNGKLEQTISSVTIKPYTQKHKLVIGGDHLNGNYTYFTGTIYSIALWKDKRTSKEISADYKNGINTYDANLMAAYDFTSCDKHLRNDISGNNLDLKHTIFWQNKKDVAPVGDYEYSFAVIGDTQTMAENDPEALENLYKWVVANKDAHKISYVLGMGDITENRGNKEDVSVKEWEYASKAISLLDGKIPYALSRGNHDNKTHFNQYLTNGFYENTIDGQMTEGDLTNTYRYFNIQGTDYLIMTLDFAPSGKALEWANSVIKNHPDHKVIVTTHAYMYRDGTTIDKNDLYPPTYYEKNGQYEDAQNGDDMWKKCFSKHKNVVLVLSGHDPWQHIVYRQDKGEKGNLVTQMLIDAQYVDKNNGSTGMVAMLYFSNEGKTVTVRYYSVEKDCYGSPESQFTINLNSHKHTYEYSSAKKATLSASGKETQVCTTCGATQSKTIYVPKSFSLSTKTYTYDGTAKKPSVTIKDSKGNKLTNNEDYIVSYDSDCKEPGKHVAKILFRGNYSGTKSLTYTVKPSKAKGLKATQTIKTLTLSWDKVAGADGYRIYKYNSSKKKYEHVKSVTSGTQYKFTGLKSGTKFKFKVRAYTKDDGVIWADYSSILETATKPTTPKITSISSKTKGKAVVKWSNVERESGFQLYYSTKKSSGFEKVKSYEPNKLAGSKSKLKSGKTYYFKVRAYRKTDSGTVYSSWSSVKSVKIK